MKKFCAAYMYVYIYIYMLVYIVLTSFRVGRRQRIPDIILIRFLARESDGASNARDELNQLVVRVCIIVLN